MRDWKSPQPLMCSVLSLWFIVLRLLKLEVAAVASPVSWLILAHTRAADSFTAEGSTCSSRMLRVAFSMIASGWFLLGFMMFLQIIADLFTQPRPGPVQRHRDDDLGRPQDLGDLLVVVTLVVTQHESGGGTTLKLGDRLADQFAKLGVGQVFFGVGRRNPWAIVKIEHVQRDRIGTFAGPHDIQGGVNGGPVEESPRVRRDLTAGPATGEPYENILQNVLRVAVAARNAVRHPEHPVVML